MTKVGYIGIGQIGGPIAEAVLKAGFDLMVFDLRDEAMQALAAVGAKTARSAREVAEHAEIVELSVTDDAAVLAAVLGPAGVLDGAQPGSVIAVHSTIHPRTVKKIAEVAKPRGIGVVDASPTGGGVGARQHTLTWMVGGEAAEVEKCRPVLEASGSHIFHMGELGTGCATKCAQQLMTTVNMMAAYEGYRLAQAAGLDMELFSQAVHLSSAESRTADNWLASWFNGMAAAQRDGFYKGLIPILQLTHDLGLAAPGAALSQQMFVAMSDPE